MGQRKKVHELLAPFEKKNAPGFVIGIIQGNKFIFRRGYGMAELENNIPITDKTIFKVASLSKQFTATCIALLEDYGRISLTDNIRKYFPEMPKYKAPITVNHLIHHTSGIRDYLILLDIAGRSNENFYTNDEVIRLISREKSLNFKPGEKYEYSNSNYLLLAEMIKRISNKTLRHFADENIFTPLGMRSTHFQDDHTMVVKNRAVGYSYKDGEGYKIYDTILDIVGDGGLFTNIDDLFLWDQNFYHNKLGRNKKRFIKHLLTSGVLNNGERIEYAFGLVINKYKGLEMVSHEGNFVGFKSDMLRFSSQKFSVICLSNLYEFSPKKLCMNIANIYLRDKFKLKEYIGEYYSEELEAKYTVNMKDGRLYLLSSNMSKFYLTSCDGDKFKFKDKEVEFIRDKKYDITGLIFNTDSIKNVFFARV